MFVVTEPHIHPQGVAVAQQITRPEEPQAPPKSTNSMLVALGEEASR
jgi:hypothetical protein